jgi:pimeloyl-ACP methyl ester carboxylesterase
MIPETRYADAGGVRIAYQVFGSGERDIVFVWGTWSHVELAWELPGAARFLRRLGSLGRVVHFDKRGIGLSDPIEGVPTLEERMDDVRAVMEAAGIERAALVGVSEGAAMTILFAATHPERVSHLALYGAFSRLAPSQDYPWGIDPEVAEPLLDHAVAHWGEGVPLALVAPKKVGDELFKRDWQRFERYAMSPTMFKRLIMMNLEIDIRPTLSSVSVPTLVLHRAEDAFIPLGAGRDLADRIPGAHFLELPGADHLFAVDPDQIVDEVAEFLTGARGGAALDRVLTTILFTDIVGSTKLGADLGDAGWGELIERHDSLVRRHLVRFSGTEVKTLGDGFMARFDGPARAIACAGELRGALRSLDIGIRAGIHTGECELVDGDVRGLAVNLAARIAAAAQEDEVLVSSTVRDLVAGSGVEFIDRGERTLKGVPGRWRLFAAA